MVKTKFNEKAAIVFLINSQRKLLMILRDDIPGILYPDFWSVPGGIIEPGESAKKAAQREVLEEIGYTVNNLKFFKSVINPLGRGGGPEKIYIYSGHIDKNISELVLTEGQQMSFVDFDSMGTMKIIPHIKKAIDQFANIASSQPI